MIGPDASPREAQPLTFCGVNIDLKQSVLPTTERFRHAVNEADRIFVELDQQGLNYDVILDIGGEKLSAHKELLMAHIPYFRAIFSHSFAESSSDIVPLASNYCGFEPAYIHSIIRSLYVGHFDLSTDTLNSWIDAAMYLNADTIIEACCRFKFTRVRCDDALSLLGYFRSIGCHALDDRLWRFIDANFVPISHSAAFKELPVEELIVIIQRHSLRVDSERQVFDAVNGWMAVDLARWVEGARLLNSVRLSSLSIRDIDSAIESVDWVKANPDCVAQLSEYKSPARRSNRTDRYCKNTVVLLCVAENLGGYTRTINGHRRRYNGHLRIYNVLTNDWTVVSLPRTLHDGMQSVAIGRKIYFLGCDGTRTRVLDTASNQWSELPTSQPVYFRYWSSIGVIDDVIYVAGGEDDDERKMSSLIALDTKADDPAWKQRAPMTHRRGGAASCVHQGRLYVFGGETTPHPITGGRELAAAEYYNPATNQWYPIAPMRRAMSGHFAAAADDRIYVVGRTSMDRRTDPENIFDSYDPVTNTWTQLASEAKLDDESIVTGGRLLSSNTSDREIWAMKAFDIETNEWKPTKWVRPGTDYPRPELCTTWMRVPATTPLPLAAIEEPWLKFDETNRP